MNKYQLTIQLLSDTTFGRGDGVAGLIDQEVQHDAFGFPYLQGRTLKGLLSEECDNLISTISSDKHRAYWENIACHLFGISGSNLETMAIMHMGDACLPNDLRKAVGWQVNEKDPTLTIQEVLDSLTTIRRQTAIDDESGVSAKGSLRSFRVVMRDLEFTTELHFQSKPSKEILSLLSVGTLALRHIGSGRNRGRGSVRCTLHNDSGDNITHDHINLFATISGEN